MKATYVILLRPLLEFIKGLFGIEDKAAIYGRSTRKPNGNTSRVSAHVVLALNFITELQNINLKLSSSNHYDRLFKKEIPVDWESSFPIRRNHGNNLLYPEKRNAIESVPGVGMGGDDGTQACSNRLALPNNGGGCGVVIILTSAEMS
ncbi:hypothetical protein OIU78_006717 [Salix suchowensis]|nr:hypothetical protein OIU78_006717 [Salix suchowensis]